MSYTKTTWTDRAVQYPNRYDKSGETSSQVTLVASPGTVTQEGTPLNAANLNKIEQGIADALPKGASNAEIADVLTMINEVDTRSITVNRTSGLVSSIVEKNGATTLRTTTINRTSGVVSSVVVTCNGKTITHTITRDGSGVVTGVTKTVV